MHWENFRYHWHVFLYNELGGRRRRRWYDSVLSTFIGASYMSHKYITVKGFPLICSYLLDMGIRVNFSKDIDSKMCLSRQHSYKLY